jgi:hypothetical protein
LTTAFASPGFGVNLLGSPGCAGFIVGIGLLERLEVLIVICGVQRDGKAAGLMRENFGEVVGMNGEAAGTGGAN